MAFMFFAKVNVNEYIYEVCKGEKSIGDPKNKIKTVSLMLKAIHASESKEVAREKAASVVKKLRQMKLAAAAKKVEEGIEETLTPIWIFLPSIGTVSGPIT